MNRVKAHMEESKLAKTFQTENEDEEAWLAEYNLLTAKPVIFAANVSEDDLPTMGLPMKAFRLCGNMRNGRTAGYL